MRLNLDAPRVSRNFVLLVPVCFGLFSLWLGADGNFDLLNYHVYNAYGPDYTYRVRDNGRVVRFNERWSR